jgi:hypothetical protein
MSADFEELARQYRTAQTHAKSKAWAISIMADDVSARAHYLAGAWYVVVHDESFDGYYAYPPNEVAPTAEIAPDWHFYDWCAASDGPCGDVEVVVTFYMETGHLLCAGNRHPAACTPVLDAAQTHVLDIAWRWL